MLDEALEILTFLEAIDWKWDILTIKKQPEILFRAVLRIKVAGEKLKRQERNKENADGR